MPNHDLPLDPTTILPMRVETFAEFAIEAALWLVRESINAIATKTKFDPNPENAILPLFYSRLFAFIRGCLQNSAP